MYLKGSWRFPLESTWLSWALSKHRGDLRLVQSPELGDSFRVNSQRQVGQLTAPRARGKVVKGSFLCQGSKTETLQGKEIRKLLSSLTSAISLSLARIPKNGVLPAKKNEHKTECQNSDESQIAHSHVAAIFHAATVHLLKD